MRRVKTKHPILSFSLMQTNLRLFIVLSITFAQLLMLIIVKKKSSFFRRKTFKSFTKDRKKYCIFNFKFILF